MNIQIELNLVNLPKKLSKNNKRLENLCIKNKNKFIISSNYKNLQKKISNNLCLLKKI